MPASISVSSLPAKLVESLVISMNMSSKARIASRFWRRRTLNASIISFNGTEPPYSFGNNAGFTLLFKSSRFLLNCFVSNVKNKENVSNYMFRCSIRKAIPLTMTRFFSFSLRTPIANSITLLAYCGKLTKYDSLRRIGVEFYIRKKKNKSSLISPRHN